MSETSKTAETSAKTAGSKAKQRYLWKQDRKAPQRPSHLSRPPQLPPRQASGRAPKIQTAIGSGSLWVQTDPPGAKRRGRLSPKDFKSSGSPGRWVRSLRLSYDVSLCI